jgi:hypothetical protein
MSRLKLEQLPSEAVFAMSGGNPGAIRVLVDSIEQGADIDPDAAMLGGFSFLMNLDTFGIYDSDIWILYKDICGENLSHTIGLVRAVQCGCVSKNDLLEAIKAERRHNLDVQSALVKLKETLPNFQLDDTN